MRLSVIIPVYNLENCVKRTLDCCMSQDMDDNEYEVICVDDGSKDGSLALLSEYSAKYKNIRVISKENGGVSSARNRGIDEAQGKYIWFVDGDDLIRENCIGKLCDLMDKENTDLLMHDIKITHNENEDFSLPLGDLSYRTAEGVVDIYNACKRSYGGGAWSYILRRDILIDNGLIYRTDMKYSEDLLFMFLYKSYCQKALIVDEKLYCYIMRPTSSIHNIDYKHHMYCFEECIKEYTRVGDMYPDENGYFKHKLNDCVKGIISDLTYIGDVKLAKDKFRELKERNLYPIKNDFYAVKNLKSIKSRLLAMRAILCTYKPVSMMIIRLKSLIRR